MSIFRIEKDKNYTVMSNYHLRDKNLSLKAKGLLSLMLSLPDDWDYSLKGLVAICKEEKDAIRSMLDELKQYKYLKIEPDRHKSGRFQYIYTIFEKPFDMPEKTLNSPNTDFPYTVNRDTEEPNTVNQPQINTNNKDKIDKIDKTSEPVRNEEHHLLTKELIKTKYVRKDDVETFCFDELFKDYLSKGMTYTELVKAIHYISSRVVKRCYRDSNGKPIFNKIDYFKTSFEENKEKFRNMPDELYPEFDELER